MTYRQFGCRLEGHPTPVLPWVDVATGSLGQGLPIGVGMALAGKRLDRLPVPHLGDLRRQRDGRGLDVGGARARRLLRARQPDRDHRRQPARPARRDDARLGPRLVLRPAARVRLARDRDRRPRRRADRRAPTRRRSRRAGKPTAIVAKTIKGKGYSKVEDQAGWHGKAVADAEARRGARRHPQPRRRRAEAGRAASRTRFEPRAQRVAALRARLGGRDAQGLRRGARGARRRAGRRRRARRRGRRTRPSPRSSARPIPSASSRCTSPSSRWSRRRSGMQVLGWKPFASTFAAFMSPRLRLRPHGRDQPRHDQALRLARRRLDRRGRPFADGARGPRRASARSTARPCSTRATGTRRRRSSRAMADLDGISYLRTTRADTAVALRARTRSSRSAARKTLREGDDVTIVAAGITVHEALKAADDARRRRDRRARDRPLLGQAGRRRDAARARRPPIVTVEDHWPEGGLGEAVLGALADADERPRARAARRPRAARTRASRPSCSHAAGIDADAHRGGRARGSSASVSGDRRRARRWRARAAPWASKRSGRGSKRRPSGAGAGVDRRAARARRRRRRAPTPPRPPRASTGRSSTSARICAQSGG